MVPVEEPKPHKKIPKEKKSEPIKKIEKHVPTRKRARKALPKVSPEKQEREKQTDKQIEVSIEKELEHIVKTRKSIEEVVKGDKKPTRGFNEDKIDELLWDLEIGLLESDVAYSVIESIKRDIKEEIKDIPFSKGKLGDFVETVLKNAITHV
jgi:fused signal recognition particle receptor